MINKTASRRPNPGLLLLLPAVVIVAKAAMHRRAMFEAGGPNEAMGRGFGRHRRFGGGEAFGPEGSGFRLPPKIEWMLETWHTRAHQSANPTPAPEDVTGAPDAGLEGEATTA